MPQGIVFPDHPEDKKVEPPILDSNNPMVYTL